MQDIILEWSCYPLSSYYYISNNPKVSYKDKKKKKNKKNKKRVYEITDKQLVLENNESPLAWDNHQKKTRIFAHSNNPFSCFGQCNQILADHMCNNSKYDLYNNKNYYRIVMNNIIDKILQNNYCCSYNKKSSDCTLDTVEEGEDDYDCYLWEEVEEDLDLNQYDFLANSSSSSLYKKKSIHASKNDSMSISTFVTCNEEQEDLIKDNVKKLDKFNQKHNTCYNNTRRNKNIELGTFQKNYPIKNDCKNESVVFLSSKSGLFDFGTTTNVDDENNNIDCLEEKNRDQQLDDATGIKISKASFKKPSSISKYDDNNTVQARMIEESKYDDDESISRQQQQQSEHGTTDTDRCSVRVQQQGRDTFVSIENVMNTSTIITPMIDSQICHEEKKKRDNTLILQAHQQLPSLQDQMTIGAVADTLNNVQDYKDEKLCDNTNLSTPSTGDNEIYKFAEHISDNNCSIEDDVPIILFWSSPTAIVTYTIIGVSVLFQRAYILHGISFIFLYNAYSIVGKWFHYHSRLPENVLAFKAYRETVQCIKSWSDQCGPIQDAPITFEIVLGFLYKELTAKTGQSYIQSYLIPSIIRNTTSTIHYEYISTIEDWRDRCRTNTIIRKQNNNNNSYKTNFDQYISDSIDEWRDLFVDSVYEKS